MLREFKAREGFVWKDVSNGQVLSEILYLGINDSIDHYEEILKEPDVIDEES